ncbi:hypothetical protein CI793_01575 [Anoxybacillus ayderensis]|uniref:Uncharacterized protein n=1 Tax=Anoxybacillus flavithermus (strain DSM 21510 / WK1) TaxID=491915 RepID=B7GI07_ANOFW|nr:Predicted protein [Anoxybacillus flavithermus WK1]THD17464.1 hypothetical protein CI793_01575 [Anoxybacillus ayderensis]
MRKGGKLHFYKNLFSSIFDDDLGRGICGRKNCDSELASDFRGVFSLFCVSPKKEAMSKKNIRA